MTPYQRRSTRDNLWSLRKTLVHTAATLAATTGNFLRFLWLLAQPRVSLAAKVLVLEKQLACYQERNLRPRRASNATRLTLAFAAPLFDWKDTLVLVKPDTLVRWHRKTFKLFWRWKSRPRGRPPLPDDMQQLVADMARNNPTWRPNRIARELSLKLGIRVAPGTIRKYLPPGSTPPPGHNVTPQRWATFVRNHAKQTLACDFLTVVTARFQILYVFVIMEVGSRKILHYNVTAHPTAEWTLQQFREAIPAEHAYRFVIHDRDGIFSHDLDHSVRNMGPRVLKTPPRGPQANAFCERVLGTARRECLDFMIAFGEQHLRRILREWVRHYNRARPHSSLGPGIPDPPEGLPVAPQPHRHRIPEGYRVAATLILGGLHHEYRLEKIAA